MNLKNQMVDEFSRTFVNTDEFADEAMYYPGTDETGFECEITFGDPAPSIIDGDLGLAGKHPVQAVASHAAMRAGILARLGTVRDPAYGDHLVVAAGSAHAGRWIVKTWQPDVGGGITLMLDTDTAVTRGAKGARKTGQG